MLVTSKRLNLLSELLLLQKNVKIFGSSDSNLSIFQAKSVKHLEGFLELFRKLFDIFRKDIWAILRDICRKHHKTN